MNTFNKMVQLIDEVAQIVDNTPSDLPVIITRKAAISLLKLARATKLDCFNCDLTCEECNVKAALHDIEEAAGLENVR